MIKHIIGPRHIWKLPEGRTGEAYFHAPDDHLRSERDAQSFCFALPEVIEPAFFWRVILNLMRFVVDDCRNWGAMHTKGETRQLFPPPTNTGGTINQPIFNLHRSLIIEDRTGKKTLFQV